MKMIPIKFCSLFLAISFVLNLVWEYVQCRPFFIHVMTPPTNAGMIQAALGDVALSSLAYGLASLKGRSLTWPLEAHRTKPWIILEFASIGEALLVEYVGLTTGRWVYTSQAALIPGTPLSVVPILQLGKRWTTTSA